MTPPKVPEKTFKFTRHVLSCNNINMGERFITNDDYEPGLSHSGILETLEYVKVHRKDFESCDVCVSNLYRTWCTAVILYGNGIKKPSSKGMTHYLNLWICPHLKEHYPKTSLYKRGNAPRPMKEMVERFKKFLDILMIIINNDKNKYTDFHFPNRIYLNLSTSDLSIMYTKSETKDEEPHYYSYSNEYDEKDNEYYKKDKDNKWLKTGNLSTFMDWFNNNFTEKEKFKNEKVHVVTHSNVMQNYLKELSLDKLKEKYRDKKNFCFTKIKDDKYKLDKIDYVGQTNCWSFETKKKHLFWIKKWIDRNNDSIEPILKNLFIEDMIDELTNPAVVNGDTDSKKQLISILKSIKMGVIKQGNAKDIEKNNKLLSLCGYQGRLDKRSLFDKTKSLFSGTRRGGKLKGKKITRKGSKLKRKKTTRKRRNTRTRKKGIVKRGGCYRDKTIQEKMEKHINNPNTQSKINEIYPQWDEEKELEKAIIMDYTGNTNLEYVKKIWEEDQNPNKDTDTDTEKRREIAKKIKQYDREELIIPILSGEIRTNNLNIPDDHKAILDYMKKAKSVYDQSEAIKDEIIHFVKTYPDKTYLEYIPFSFNKDNLVFEELSSNIFKLDKDGRPIFNTYRELLDENHTHLWNILHKDDGLSTYAIIDFKSMDEQKYSSSYDEIKDKLIKTSCNNQLKQNIETYIKRHPNNTYEDWINQDDIFRKYVMPDKRNIFSIMYLDEHPALHYWNEYSKNENNSNNLVTRRTKENKDSAKPNDPNIYVYKIENKKP